MGSAEEASTTYTPGRFRTLKKKWMDDMAETLKDSLAKEDAPTRRKRLEHLWFTSKARADAIGGMSPSELKRRRFDVRPAGAELFPAKD